MQAIRIVTLRDHVEHGYAITAHCSRYGKCSHWGPVRMDSLIQHLGWDYPVVAGRARLRRLLVCSMCGQREPEIVMAPAPQPKPPESTATHSVMDMLPIEEATRRDLERRAMARERDKGDPVRPYAGRYRKFGPRR